jgi:hypothetical protein
VVNQVLFNHRHAQTGTDELSLSPLDLSGDKHRRFREGIFSAAVRHLSSVL